MSKKTFMLDITTPFKTLSVEVDEDKTLKECLDIADKMGKDAGHYPYTIKIGHYIFASAGDGK